MRLALLPLLTLLACPALSQTIQHVPDVDMTTLLGPGLATSTGEPSYNVHDADWTADGRLAFAVVRKFQTTQWWNDTLIVGLHDPVTGNSTVLGAFTGLGWSFNHVSLAVPDRFYDVEGQGHPDGTTPIDDLNQVHVALSAEAPVYVKGKVVPGGKLVRVVRLLSVSYTSVTPKLRVVAPSNLSGAPVPSTSEGPHAELSLRGDAKGYAIDMILLDPQSTYDANGNGMDDGHVMLATSYDQGNTLGSACFITGPKSPACAVPGNPLGSSRYSRPVLAYDDQGKGTRLMAVADVGRGIIHLAKAAGNSLEFMPVVATFPPGQGHSQPRIAVRQGKANVTYLVGSVGGGGVRPLDWFSSTTQGGYVQHMRITPLAQSAGDIEVRGNDAFIVVRQAPDQGVPSSVVMAYDANRTNPLSQPVGVRVDDEFTDSNLRVISALTPEYAMQALVKSAVFRFVHKLASGESHSGLMRDDF